MNILHRISYGCTFLVAMTLCALAQAGSAKAASFQGLGDLPDERFFGRFYSRATDVSADGSTVVGESSSANGSEVFRWTQETGMQGLGFLGDAYGVSADGSVVVGNSYSANKSVAFRWTRETGRQGLGDLPGGNFLSGAADVSADGSAVVGYSSSANGSEAFRWTQENGMQGLGYLGSLPDGRIYSSAKAISGDGSVVVGSSSSNNSGAFRWTEENGMQELEGFISEVPFLIDANGVSADGSVVVGEVGFDQLDDFVGIREAFRWTEEDGIQSLGNLLDGDVFYSVASDVSADGLTIVGQGNSADNGGRDIKAFIWDSENGMRALQDVLTDDYELDLTGWSLTQANAISDDGLTIVGSGRNPQGNFEGWIARIDGEPNSKPVPEPSFILATAIAGGFGTLFKKLKKKAS